MIIPPLIPGKKSVRARLASLFLTNGDGGTPQDCQLQFGHHSSCLALL